MNSETSTIKVKSCNSCKRSLPFNYFGIRKFSADGYNPCCKDCRSFRRRVVKNDNAEQTFPLNEHNRRFLLKLNKKGNWIELVGLNLKTLKPLKILYKQTCRDDIFYIKIKTTKKDGHTLVHYGTKEDFLELVLPSLLRLNIRLFFPQDRNTLINWGFSF